MGYTIQDIVQDTLLNLGQRNNKFIKLHARINFGLAGVVGDGFTSHAI